MAKHGKVFNTFTLGILATMSLGLFNFFWVFFTQTFPKSQARLESVETKEQRNYEYLQRIDNKTGKIIDILMQRK